MAAGQCSRKRTNASVRVSPFRFNAKCAKAAKRRQSALKGRTMTAQGETLGLRDLKFLKP